MRTGRRFVGYDTDPAYVKLAAVRVIEEREAPVTSQPERRAAQVLAVDLLKEVGFVVAERNHKVPGLGLEVSVDAIDLEGEHWYFDVTGAFTSTPSGLVRADTLWKSLGRASVLAASGITPVVLLSSHLPPRRSSGDRALRAVGPNGVHDVMGTLNEPDRERLARYAKGGHHSRPLPGFWTEDEFNS